MNSPREIRVKTYDFRSFGGTPAGTHLSIILTEIDDPYQRIAQKCASYIRKAFYAFSNIEKIDLELRDFFAKNLVSHYEKVLEEHHSEWPVEIKTTLLNIIKTRRKLMLAEGKNSNATVY